MSFNSEITPTLEQVIRGAIESRLTEIHTALPGEILTYDPSKQMASIQLTLQRKYVTGELVKVPVLNDVPVVHPRSGASIVHMPLKPGDHVLVIFSERSIDIWKTQGGHPDPKDARKHHYSDAVAIPGLYPFNAPITIENPDALTIKNGQSRIEVKTDSINLSHPNGEIDFNSGGTIKIQNKAGGVELMDLLTRLVQAIIDARTETLLGPMPLLNLGADPFPALLALFSKLKG